MAQDTSECQLGREPKQTAVHRFSARFRARCMHGARFKHDDLRIATHLVASTTGVAHRGFVAALLQQATRGSRATIVEREVQAFKRVE